MKLVVVVTEPALACTVTGEMEFANGRSRPDSETLMAGLEVLNVIKEGREGREGLVGKLRYCVPSEKVMLTVSWTPELPAMPPSVSDSSGLIVMLVTMTAVLFTVRRRTSGGGPNVPRSSTSPGPCTLRTKLLEMTGITVPNRVFMEITVSLKCVTSMVSLFVRTSEREMEPLCHTPVLAIMKRVFNSDESEPG